jgi:hypothetical protein
MHYFEVRKLPGDVDAGNELELLLSLFQAKTEEKFNTPPGVLPAGFGARYALSLPKPCDPPEASTDSDESGETP